MADDTAPVRRSNLVSKNPLKNNLLNRAIGRLSLHASKYWNRGMCREFWFRRAPTEAPEDRRYDLRTTQFVGVCRGRGIATAADGGGISGGGGAFRACRGGTSRVSDAHGLGEP